MKIARLAVFGLSTGLLLAASDARERLDAAADVMTEIMSAPDKGIPRICWEKRSAWWWYRE